MVHILHCIKHESIMNMLKPGTLFIRNTKLWFVIAHVSEHEFYMLQIHINFERETTFLRYYDAIFFENYCEEICKV